MAADKVMLKRWLALSLLFSIVGLVFWIIWAPWFSFNHVPEPELDWNAADAARRAPAQDVLEEVGRFGLLEVFDWKDDKELIVAAEKILAGHVALPGFPEGALPRPRGPVEMASGPTMWQLFIHSLGLPRLLLDAYKASGRLEFLQGAVDYLVEYDAYESSEWSLPGGYLWYDGWRTFVRNDHAIAARGLMLIEFWRVYRGHAEYDPKVGSAVLRMAERCAHLLAEPRRFTVATNHGVMQNLALCSIGLSFPTLSNGTRSCRLAFDRLDEQMSFFINDEGYILEHSPGYQRFSLRLVGIGMRLRTLSGQTIPEAWIRKYQAAQRTYAVLRRPDGSMPMFGDTDGGDLGKGPVVTTVDSSGVAGPLTHRNWIPDAETAIAPVAGYALWWDGLATWPDLHSIAQTAIAWSYFEGMGHKHADELSMSIWAGGVPWLDNVGYWSYDATGRELAESWEGSNAPHFVGEPTVSKRETYLRYHGRNDKLSAIDVERIGPGEFRARRQLIEVGKGIWVVIDTSAPGSEKTVRTIWTTAPEIEIKELGVRGAYLLIDRPSDSLLRAYFSLDNSTTQRFATGNESPFAGWRVLDGKIRKAPSIIVERLADSPWSLAAWSIERPSLGGANLADAPQMQEWRGAENWRIMLPTGEGQIFLTRRQGQLVLTTASGVESSLSMETGADVSRSKAELREHLSAVATKYGAPNMSGIYRVKVSILLILQAVASLVLVRRIGIRRKEWVFRTSAISLVMWMLVSFYFVVVRTPLV